MNERDKQSFINELQYYIHVIEIDDFTNDEIIELVEDRADYLNAKWQTNYELPKFTNVEKRKKRCEHCQNLFFDITSKNQSKACSILPARTASGAYVHLNGKKISECYRELRNDKKRVDVDLRRWDLFSASQSVPDHLIVPIGASLERRLKDDKTLTTVNKRVTQNYDDMDEQYWEHVRYTSDITQGIIGDFGKVLDAKKYKELDSVYKPSRVKQFNVFKHSWHELRDEIKQIYKSENEFNQYKERTFKKVGA